MHAGLIKPNLDTTMYTYFGHGPKKKPYRGLKDMANLAPWPESFKVVCWANYI